MASTLHTTLKDEARECLKQTVKAYEEAERSLSITQAAWVYAVSTIMLYYRLNGGQDQVSYVTSKQKLTPKEEGSLKNWVLFLPRIKCYAKWQKNYYELSKILTN